MVSKHPQYRGILASIQKKYADRFDPKMTKKCEGKNSEKSKTGHKSNSKVGLFSTMSSATDIFSIYCTEYAFSASQLEWYLTNYFTLRFKDNRFVKQVI